MSDPKPSIGRIVHYVSRGSADGVFESVCRAAIVTDVPADAGDSPVGLAVFHRDGLLFTQGITYLETGPTGPTGQAYRGTWHWPERV